MKTELDQTLNVLKTGGTILYPTDTIWGIGCDACSEEAVQKIFSIKKRDPHKSLIILLDTPNKLQSYISEVPDIAWDLIEFAESPLTLILPGAKNLAPSVINQDGSVGIRILKEGSFAYELVKRFRKPLVSSSANFSGKEAASHFGAIEQELIGAVDHVCDVPDEGTGSASTIMKLEQNGTFSFIRR